MEEQETDPKASEDVRQAVRAFYDLHPYPPPVNDLDHYRQLWQDETRLRADFHLHWPDRAYQSDINVLVAGCGTTQAAKYALREPSSHVVGIDFSRASVHHAEKLKRKYHLINLAIHQLPIEQVGDLGLHFDKIVCTGVLHHLQDPDEGLRALKEVLNPDGSMHLMVYASYGRAGIYMLQEYCRRLGIGHSDPEILDLARTLTYLPRNHPLALILSESPDFQSRGALADALLNPQDRAYTVPQLFDFIDKGGLAFDRWLLQAPYSPECGILADTPHNSKLTQLPEVEKYAAVELFRGTMLRHSLIVKRADRTNQRQPILFEREIWRNFVPIRMPGTISVQKRLPPGASAVLLNQNHVFTDLILPINKIEQSLVETIDGKHTIAEISHHIKSKYGLNYSLEEVRSFFMRLWWYDQVVFDTSSTARAPSPANAI